MNDIKKKDIGTWKKDLRLYVHVPFCVKKCYYCDFLSNRSNEEEINSYFEALYKEINSYKGRVGDYRVASVFIGGGTPSCVASEKIVHTLEELKKVFDWTDNNLQPEISIEVNPGTVDASYPNAGKMNLDGLDENKLLAYKKAGINRISFGLQSSHDNELKLLGRIHTYSQFEDNYKLARQLGFNNINIDLMSALPGQNIKSWEETLYKIIELQPEHISAYSLIIEEGTPFYNLYGPEGKKKNQLPSEDVERKIYERTKEILSSFGYERYEISNYALKGYECRHNLAYWELENYLGLGLGAASLIENTRFHNTNKMQEYLALLHKNDDKNLSIPLSDHNNSIMDDNLGIRREIVTLTEKEQMEEFMFLGLRKTKGVNKISFYNKFGVTVDEIYNKVLKKLEEEELIYIDNDHVWLTDYGIDISNRVLAEFLLD